MNTDHAMLAPPQYASFGRRLLAAFLDALILVIPAFVFNRALPILGGVLIVFIYFPLLESSEIRATIGKKLAGIQVADLSGRRITLRAAMLRCLVRVVSGMFLFIGHFFALFTARQQALHDLAAETIVVYGRSERPVVDAWIDEAKSVLGSVQMPSASVSSLDQLERLQSLRDRGALTEDEFQAEKRKILTRS